MDTTDIVDYNVSILNHNDLVHSFFCVSKDDPTVGFAFDATTFAGYTYPKKQLNQENAHAGIHAELEEESLRLRLRVASHFAQYLRHQLEEQKGGYTSTVGISTSKLLSKLVGNVNKPKAQTTLEPPYMRSEHLNSNVTAFIDGHEVGKIPGIGFKLATKIRNHVLQKTIDYDQGLVTGKTRDTVATGHVRRYPQMSAELLEKLLSGPGSPHGIGGKIWSLINGIDDSEVGQAREVPRQISIEDSYIRLDTIDEVLKELGLLARSLIRRMRIDLLDEDDLEPTAAEMPPENALPTDSRRWLAHPRKLRLSTRPRPAPNPNGSRNRSFGRISRSGPLPNFVFSLFDSIDAIADKLVAEALVPMFRKLHPEKSGWNLSLVNLAVTNMADAASDKGNGAKVIGRDIGNMFRRQEDFLKEWKVEDRGVPPEKRSSDETELAEEGNTLEELIEKQLQPLQEQSIGRSPDRARHGSEDYLCATQDSTLDRDWDSSDESMLEGDAANCDVCGSRIPLFAIAAHERFHSAGE